MKKIKITAADTHLRTQIMQEDWYIHALYINYN